MRDTGNEKWLLTAESVAVRLDISPSSAYRMIQDGRIPSVQIEGTQQRRVPVSELRKWLQTVIEEQLNKPTIEIAR